MGRDLGQEKRYCGIKKTQLRTLCQDVHHFSFFTYPNPNQSQSFFLYYLVLFVLLKSQLLTLPDPLFLMLLLLLSLLLLLLSFFVSGPFIVPVVQNCNVSEDVR